MDAASGPGRVRIAPHALVLALILLVALALSERSTGFTTDEGSYAIQAESLRRGSWDIDWPFRTVDPEGAGFPYHGAVISDNGEFAYVSHPAWPMALAVMPRGVPVGIRLRLLSIVAVLMTATSALVLAHVLRGAASPTWAFWLVATSPVLANGLMIWAHAPAAALAGIASVCLAELLSSGSRRWALPLFGTLAVGVLIRSEFVLLAIAMVTVLGVVGVRRRSGRLGLVAVGCAVITVAAMSAEARWISSIVGTDGSTALPATRAGGSGAWLTGRLDGAVTALLKGATDTPVAALASVGSIMCIAFVVANPKRMPAPRLAILWLAVVLGVVRVVAAPGEAVIGLLAAWPVVLLAGAAVRRATSTERCLLAVVGLYAFAVFATQYDDGGGLQWGGRFLGLAIVPLGVAAAGGLARLEAAARGSSAAVAALSVIMGVLSLVATDHVRSENEASLGAALSTSSSVILVSNTQFARLDWLGETERCWLYVDPEHIDQAVQVLRRARITGAGYALFDAETLREHGLDARPLSGYVLIGRVGDGHGTCPASERLTGR